ncbi:MAG: hypothetical protein ABL927_08325 [Bdellovibrionales bacterium]
MRFWFTLENGVLYAHDYDDHQHCIALAIKAKNKWRVILDLRSNGHRLIYKVVHENIESKILKTLDELYTEYGHYR